MQSKNCAKGRSKEALQLNRDLDNIKAQIIKHYQYLSDRVAFVTAEMVRRSALATLCSAKNAYQGMGSEYETLLGVFDKDIENFKKRVGKDRTKSTLSAMKLSRSSVADFIQAHYRRKDISMLELTPDFFDEQSDQRSSASRISRPTSVRKEDWPMALSGSVACG